MLHVVANGRHGKDAERGDKGLRFSLSILAKRTEAPVWVQCYSYSLPDAILPHLKKGTAVSARGILQPLKTKEGGEFLMIKVEGISFLPSGEKSSQNFQNKSSKQPQKNPTQDGGTYRSFSSSYVAKDSDEIPF